MNNERQERGQVLVRWRRRPPGSRRLDDHSSRAPISPPDSSRDDPADDVAASSGAPTLGQVDELVGQCEAFLLGQLPEFFADRGRAVPPWAWAGLVAHASPERLAQLARSRTELSGPMSDYAGWRFAVSATARAILRLAQGDLNLARRLQRVAIEPIEEELTTPYAQLLWLAGGDPGSVQCFCSRNRPASPDASAGTGSGGWDRGDTSEPAVTPSAFLLSSRRALLKAAGKGSVEGPSRQ